MTSAICQFIDCNINNYDDYNNYIFYPKQKIGSTIIGHRWLAIFGPDRHTSG